MDEATPLCLPTPHPGRSGILRRDRNGLPDDPPGWPASFKWAIVALLAFASFTVTFGCIAVAPVASRMTNDLDGGAAATSSAVLLVTTWELSEAAGPLFIASLSEMFGRWPLFNVANVFIMATMLGALAESTPVLAVSRVLTGMAVAANVLNPAVIADLFPSKQRGTAMSFIMLAPLVASSVGPLFSSLVAHHLGWRAVLWTTVALATLCELAFLTCFRETHKPTLRRNEARLRKKSQCHLEH